MAVRKWVMKQYWRVSQIRILTSLGLSMLVIGKLYLDYVPILRDYGGLGALLLGMMLFLAFLGLGWIYDTRMRMWSQKFQANYERHAYYHIPAIRSLTYEYPIVYALVQTIKGVAEKVEIDDSAINRISEFMQEYFSLRANRRDIERTIEMSNEFLEEYPISETGYQQKRPMPLASRLKLGWETQILRLTWIQSLTGLVQDVLVFGALYVFVLFPDATSANALFLAFFAISVPLLILLVILGWVYDRKLRIWSADTTVKIERNPYTFVLQPGELTITIPFFYALLSVLYDISSKLGLDTEELERVILYFDEYTKLQTTTSKDLDRAMKMRASLGGIFGGN